MKTLKNNKYEKAQFIRVLDVVFIGPYMIWFALNSDMKESHKLILGSLGLATIVYNYNNWRLNKTLEELS